VNDQGPFTPAVDMVPGAPFTALPAAGVETTHGFGVSFDASSSLIVWTTQSDGTWVQVGSYSPGAYDGINFDVVQFGWEVAGRPNCGGMGTGAQPQNPDTDLGKVAYFLKAEVQTELGGEWTAAELTGASDQEDTSRGYLIATGTDPDWGSFAFGGGPK